ncbi:MAG: DNA adenine methylase [Nanoarchaeota archaeon]
MTKSAFAVPTFIKWAGGKTQLLEQFSELYPEDFNNYHEAFLGSGAVFFQIKQLFKPTRSFLSDTNEELIRTFVSVRDYPEELIELLIEHKEKDNNREYFNEQRERFNIMRHGLEKSSIFIYLNKTCFNGLYRVNADGKFNVPFGKYKNPAIVNEEKIRKASAFLQGANLYATSFTSILQRARKNDFVYFDPPYFPLNKTANFTGYQKDGFFEKEQRHLAEVFEALDKRGVKVMLSNSDMPLIKELYDDFDIVNVRARRAINCIGTKRGKINEIVVRNY